MATSSYILPAVPFFLQKETGDDPPIYYTAADFRRFLAASLRRTGVLGSSHFVVQQADNVGFAVKVNSGYARVGADGYLVSLASDVTINLAGFNTNPAATRTHKVWLVVHDKLIAAAGYDGQIQITEDVGSGAPAPDDCAAYLQIATISLARGQSNIQNKHIDNIARHGGTAGEYFLLANYLNSAHESAGGTGGTADFRGIYADGFVRLSGSVGRNDGKPFPENASTVIGTMMSNFRPSRTRYLTCATSSFYPCRLKIDADGTMTVAVADNQAPTFVHFDGVTYDLDGNTS